MPLPDVVTTCEYRSPHPFLEGRVTGIIDDLWEKELTGTGTLLVRWWVGRTCCLPWRRQSRIVVAQARTKGSNLQIEAAETKIRAHAVCENKKKRRERRGLGGGGI